MVLPTLNPRKFHEVRPSPTPGEGLSASAPADRTSNTSALPQAGNASMRSSLDKTRDTTGRTSADAYIPENTMRYDEKKRELEQADHEREQLMRREVWDAMSRKYIEDARRGASTSSGSPELRKQPGKVPTGPRKWMALSTRLHKKPPESSKVWDAMSRKYIEDARRGASTSSGSSELRKQPGKVPTGPRKWVALSTRLHEKPPESSKDPVKKDGIHPVPSGQQHEQQAPPKEPMSIKRPALFTVPVEGDSDYISRSGSGSTSARASDYDIAHRADRTKKSRGKSRKMWVRPQTRQETLRDRQVVRNIKRPAKRFRMPSGSPPESIPESPPRHRERNKETPDRDSESRQTAAYKGKGGDEGPGDRGVNKSAATHSAQVTQPSETAEQIAEKAAKLAFWKSMEGLSVSKAVETVQPPKALEATETTESSDVARPQGPQNFKKILTNPLFRMIPRSTQTPRDQSWISSSGMPASNLTTAKGYGDGRPPAKKQKMSGWGDKPTATPAVTEQPPTPVQHIPVETIPEQRKQVEVPISSPADAVPPAKRRKLNKGGDKQYARPAATQSASTSASQAPIYAIQRNAHAPTASSSNRTEAQAAARIVVETPLLPEEVIDYTLPEDGEISNYAEEYIRCGCAIDSVLQCHRCRRLRAHEMIINKLRVQCERWRVE